MSKTDTILRRLLCLIPFAVSSCLSGRWHTIAKGVSPSGDTAVAILSRCVGPDCIIQIRRTQGGTTSVLLDERVDRLPTAALVAWSDDSATVATVVCDKVAGNLFAGFDATRGSRVHVSTTETVVREWVERHYG